MPVATYRKPSVLVFGGPEYGFPRTDALAEVAEITWLPYSESPKDALTHAIATSGPFVAFAATFVLGKPFPPGLNEDYLAPLFPSLKMICTPGAGYEKVDVGYLSKRGCLLANSPTAVGVRTADGAVMLLLAAMRGLTPYDLHMRSGGWRDPALRTLNWRECTLGVVGLGNIGAQVAAMASALGFRRIVYSNRRKRDVPYDHIALDTLYAEADAIVLCCPLTPETRHLVDDGAFGKMKRGVVLVNVARGPVIDEEALVRALETGQVMRAALDVFEHEPEVHPSLRRNPNVTLSPHNTAAPDSMSGSVNGEVIDNVIAFVRTGMPLTPVNAADLA
ncbi:glyoxylate reductase [Cryptotrichosporon argae]